jgi:DNA-binding transcriptional regulator YiaG
MTPASEFRLLRKRRCLTGEALARLLGHITGRNVRYRESGEQPPPHTVLLLMRLWAGPRLPKALRLKSPSTR